MKRCPAGVPLLLFVAVACTSAYPAATPPRLQNAQVVPTSLEAPLEARAQALRDRDVEAIVALFAGDATVRSSGGRISAGTDEIRAFTQDQVDRNQVEELVRPRAVEGDTVRWTVRVSRDDWRALGVDDLEVVQEAVVRGGRIHAFTNTFTPEAAARLGQAREAAARRPSQHLEDTWFAWIGGREPDDVFYHRIPSPVVLVAFDHQRPIALPGAPRDAPTRQHVHTVVRTPNGNEHGRDLLLQHHPRHSHSH
jgi:hypothetical protein